MKENKLPEDNEKKFDDLGFGNDFVDTIEKQMSMRERIDNLDFIKILKTILSKRERKVMPQTGKKLFI